MNILITGASGFVGTHLCNRLIKDGHHVFALVRTPSKFTEVNKSDRLKVIQGDLDHHDLTWVSLLPEDLHACVHTAGIVHSYVTEDFFQTNAKGTLNLVDNLKKRYASMQFVLISSLAAAGPSMGPEMRTEEDLDFPVSIYGRSKKKAEDYLKEFAPPEWTLSIIRPPMIIGPKDSAVLDIFKMVKGKGILLPGSNAKSKMYSFVCVFDLIETIAKIMDHKKSGLFYSAHPHIVTFNELIHEIKKQMGIRFIFKIPIPLFILKVVAFILHFIHKFFQHQLRLTPDKYYELAATNWTCSGKKSETELSQVYHYDIEKTISITLQDYRNRRWI
jgi:nucleoside-diphosphate-sugar epimerase